jgi:hypothetical protein
MQPLSTTHRDYSVFGAIYIHTDSPTGELHQQAKTGLLPTSPPRTAGNS